MNKDLRAGSTMIAPMFINVGATDSIKISDIGVTGYPEYKDYDGGTGGDVVINVLNSSGGLATDEDGNPMAFYYFDNINTDPEMGGFGKGWYRNAEATEENKVTADNLEPFAAGQGLWVQGVDDYFLHIKAPTLD